MSDSWSMVYMAAAATVRVRTQRNNTTILFHPCTTYFLRILSFYGDRPLSSPPVTVARPRITRITWMSQHKPRQHQQQLPKWCFFTLFSLFFNGLLTVPITCTRDSDHCCVCAVRALVQQRKIQFHRFLNTMEYILICESFSLMRARTPEKTIWVHSAPCFWCFRYILCMETLLLLLVLLLFALGQNVVVINFRLNGSERKAFEKRTENKIFSTWNNQNYVHK